MLPQTLQTLMDLRDRVRGHLDLAAQGLRRSFRRLGNTVTAMTTDAGYGAMLVLTVSEQSMAFVANAEPSGTTGALTVRVHVDGIDPAPTDSVTIAPGETAEERWKDIEELIDRMLAAAVDRFAYKLS